VRYSIDNRLADISSNIVGFNHVLDGSMAWRPRDCAFSPCTALGDARYRPSTSIEDGIGRFISWYRDYFKV